MIIIGIVLCIVGLLVLIFSCRGRIVARGQFCRRCKFDLAGLDIDSANTKCPECGRGIHHESGRRAMLRRKSRWGLVGAAILMLGGISTLGFWASGNASVILGVMPDAAVVGLTDMGMDAALDELVTRVSRVPNPMSASKMSNVIESGLAHQADLMVAFDPRWGEVLYVACVNGQMSDDQIKQYMLNGITIEMLIRDRVHQGAYEVDCQMKIMPGRLSALNGGDTGYLVQAKWVADGIVGDPPSKKLLLHGNVAASVRVPTRGRWTNSAPYTIGPIVGGVTGEIGSKVRVYTQYDLMIKAPGGQYGIANAVQLPRSERFDGFTVLKRVNVEQEVEIIDPSEPIVQTMDDPKLVGATINSLSIMPIQLMKVFQEPQYQSTVLALSISRLSESLPESIALQVYLRLDDSREVQVGSWVNKGPHNGIHGAGIQWRIDPKDEEKLALAQEIVDRLIEQGKTDVIFRTDARLAEENPEITQVVGLTIIFEDVPVEVVESHSNMWNSASDKWITGKVIEEAEGEGAEQP